MLISKPAILFVLAALIGSLGCASTPLSTKTYSSDSLRTTSFTGKASWYGKAFKGRRTASGEPFDPAQMTAAHKTLAFGTQVRVTHLGNGRSVIVRINDRGPFVAGRIIDLSEAAARQLDMIREGVAAVRVDLLNSTAR